MAQEIYISGIGIAPEVIGAVVTRAVEEVEGIASVGVKDLATNLVSMFQSRSAPAAPAVEAEVVNDQLALTVHVVVFFGLSLQEARGGRACCRCARDRCPGGRRGRARRRLH